MVFRIATGFDRTKRDEVFTAVKLSDEAAAEVIQNFFNSLTYAEREVWIDKHMDTVAIVS